MQSQPISGRRRVGRFARVGVVMSGIVASLVVGVVAAPSASAMPRICDYFTRNINNAWNAYTAVPTHGNLMNYVEALDEAEDVGCL
jgi:hypothetical protein